MGMSGRLSPSPEPKPGFGFPVSRPFRFTFILLLAALGHWLWPRSAAGATRAPRRRSADRSSSSRSTRCAPTISPAYGYTKVKTPAIDALAADGVVFERAYSHAPQTLPAHAVAALRAAAVRARRARQRRLHGQDRRAAAAADAARSRLRDRRRSCRRSCCARTPASARVSISSTARCRRRVARTPASVRCSATARESEAIAERWLDSHRLVARVPVPASLRAAQAVRAAGTLRRSTRRTTARSPTADEIVGKLMQYLKSHQLYDRSTIVLLSDHGEGLGDHGEQEHGLFVYDEAIHVPLIIKQESNAGAGPARRRSRPAHRSRADDPRSREGAGARQPARPFARNRCSTAPARLPESAVYSEALYARYHFGWSELTALTDERYRYIKAPRDELYDLQRDPHERDNLAERAARRRARRCAARSIGWSRARRSSAAERVRPMRASGSRRLGYVGRADRRHRPAAPGETLPIRKTSVRFSRRYRAAVDLAGERKWIAGDRPAAADPSRGSRHGRRLEPARGVRHAASIGSISRSTPTSTTSS